MCSAFVSVTAQLFEKVPVSFFGWSLNLKVFVVALHMNTQLWYRKGYKIPKKLGHPIVHCTCVCDSAIICTNDCPPSTSLTWTYFFFGKKHALPAIIMLNLIFHIAMDNLVKKKLFSLARNKGGGVWTAIWITCAILPQREKAEVSKSCGQENNLGTRRRK